MPEFTINLIEGGAGVEVIDHQLKKTYKFTNAQKSMGTSIYEQYHHDANGRSLSINDQPDWLESNSLTFDISNSEDLIKARKQLNAGPHYKNGGSRRRRRPSRKYKKSAKRVFMKKSRSTRRR